MRKDNLLAIVHTHKGWVAISDTEEVKGLAADAVVFLREHSDEEHDLVTEGMSNSPYRNMETHIGGDNYAYGVNLDQTGWMKIHPDDPRYEELWGPDPDKK